MIPEMVGSGLPGSSLTSSKPGMAYRVNISARAQRCLALLFTAIEAESSDAALAWYLGLKEAILSLERTPCGARSPLRIRASDTCSMDRSPAYIASSTASDQKRDEWMCFLSGTAREDGADGRNSGASLFRTSPPAYPQPNSLPL